MKLTANGEILVFSDFTTPVRMTKKAQGDLLSALEDAGPRVVRPKTKSRGVDLEVRYWDVNQPTICLWDQRNGSWSRTLFDQQEKQRVIDALRENIEEM